MKQATIARKFVSEGIGLHGGEEVEITLRPAPVDSGIVFVSLGAGGEGSDVEIPACIERVHSSSRATTLSAESASDLKAGPKTPQISTVEHLLAAIFALDFHNLRIEVSGSEIPVMDGSALPFVDWLRTAGRETQSRPCAEFEIQETVEIREGAGLIRAEPAEDLSFSYTIDFDHPRIGRQCLEIEKLDDKVFEQQIAPARTFGFLHEVDALRNAGLALGGSLDNTIVLDEEGVLNEGGLRSPDEFVRHKIIDLIGDLALLGARPKAHITVERGGHRLHHRLIEALAVLTARATPTL